jgi:hypothetical protein
MRVIAFALLMASLATAPAAAQGNLAETARGVSIGSGSRAMGMGGAFIAVADDASAASWNPAGLAVLEKPEASLVWKARDRGTESQGRAAFRNQYAYQGTFSQTLDWGATDRYHNSYALSEAIDSLGQNASLSSSSFDFASATYPLSIGGFKVVPQVSYQRAIDLGYAARSVRPQQAIVRSTSRTVTEGTTCGDWGCDPWGGWLDTSWSTDTRLEFDQRASGGVDVWAASLALSPHPKVFLGISANWWRGEQVVEGTSRLSSDECWYQNSLEGGESGPGCEAITTDAAYSGETSYRGFNLNLGLLVRPVSWLKIGAVYKTPFSMTLDSVDSAAWQRQTVTNIGPYPSHGSDSQRGASKVTWPRTAGLGLAVMPSDTLTLALDFTWSAWKDVTESFQQTANQMGGGIESWVDEPFSYSNQIQTEGKRRWPSLLPLSGTPFQSANPDQLRDQSDAFQVRGGLELLLVRGSFVVPLRAGVILDRPYFSDLAGNAVTNWGFTVGAGLTWSAFVFDVAFVHQEYAYGGAYELSNQSALFDVSESYRTSLRTERDSRFSSDRLYLSTIVRF